MAVREKDNYETVKVTAKVARKDKDGKLSLIHISLIEYYEKAGVLKQVDGTQDMEAVFQDIVKILGA